MTKFVRLRPKMYSYLEKGQQDSLSTFKPYKKWYSEKQKRSIS